MAIGNTKLGVGSEVAEKDAIYSADESRVYGGAGAVTKEGPAVVGEPGSSGEGIYWEMRARSKEINVEALHNTQGLHTMERDD